MLFGCHTVLASACESPLSLCELSGDARHMSRIQLTGGMIFAGSMYPHHTVPIELLAKSCLSLTISCRCAIPN
jgi:hypothetical protein